MDQLSASPLVTEKTEESFSVLDVAGLNYADAATSRTATGSPTGSSSAPRRSRPTSTSYWRLVEDQSADHRRLHLDRLGLPRRGRHRTHRSTPTSPHARPRSAVPFPGSPPGAATSTSPATAAHVLLPGDRVRPSRRPLHRRSPTRVLRPPTPARRRGRGATRYSSWTWDVPADHPPTEVEVYSDADEIELVTQRHAHRPRKRREGEGCLARFQSAYQPGELTAIAYRAGARRPRHPGNRRRQPPAVRRRRPGPHPCRRH